MEGDIQICYTDDPLEPMLQCLCTINRNPFKYKTYVMKECEVTRDNSNKDLLQFMHFLNEVYQPVDPEDSDAYEFQSSVSAGSIMAKVLPYTNMFDSKSVRSFSKWCTDKKLALTNASSKRMRLQKCNDDSRAVVRPLFVLKEELIQQCALKIIKLLGQYQQYINDLKSEDLHVVGYCRKSYSGISDDQRLMLLMLMARRLEERSLVDAIYVSWSSSASDPMEERDISGTGKEKLKELNAQGDTQDLLSLLASGTKKICLVVTTFAGLTTNHKDLLQVFHNHPSLDKLIVDNLVVDDTILCISRNQVLNDPNVLKDFSGRTCTVPRSK
ncbi:hypothetical protein DM01DRAFT_1379705 [Hesseltinella vesiculosa]|uniref:Uncharacterized protein n=1 Tax=Hesseltinella vesiculosa TaxID=101127 RepID=A0A1X2GYN2_9FUNG|nr:hypothetical protein DM01DRAFT_1379705 [Hesseltinella vesiculosa]